MALNLGILFFFKYYGFAADSVKGLFALAHVELELPAFDVLLPVGISFYTFQAIGYLADVRRGEVAAERNFCPRCSRWRAGSGWRTPDSSSYRNNSWPPAATDASPHQLCQLHGTDLRPGRNRGGALSGLQPPLR